MENNKQSFHVYDGIEEQNNPMPDWWIWLFILTVIFSLIYWLHYTSGSGVTLKEEYDVAIKAYQEKNSQNLNNSSSETEESLMAFMKSENSILEGKNIYSAKCAMCHGVQLEGKIGPNLTDTFWITGKGTRVDVVKVIQKGAPAKGMPPWEALLKPEEIKYVASYVFSKKGSNPSNAKISEGVEVK
ncbi:MAG: cbb3-type cytochrome c oxidase N-terminal domain-containing protein [Bdellovibrionota bacterium]